MMRLAALRAFALAGVALLGVGAAARATGNGCSLTSGSVELMICANPGLSGLDDRLAAAYALARQHSNDPILLAREQQAWLAARNGCASVACVAELYQARIGGLSRPARAGAEVKLVEQYGVFTVPVAINGVLTMNFLVDSGAADVSIPAEVFATLVRTGSVDASDAMGERIYTLADGRSIPTNVFRIRSLTIGDRTLQNVTASVGPARGNLLLGQSFLRRFRGWAIDNQRGVLTLD